MRKVCHIHQKFNVIVAQTEIQINFIWASKWWHFSSSSFPAAANRREKNNDETRRKAPTLGLDIIPIPIVTTIVDVMNGKWFSAFSSKDFCFCLACIVCVTISRKIIRFTVNDDKPLALNPRVRYLCCFVVFFFSSLLSLSQLIAFNFLNKTYTSIMDLCVIMKKASRSKWINDWRKALSHKVDSITVTIAFQPTNKNNVLFIFGMNFTVFLYPTTTATAVAFSEYARMRPRANTQTHWWRAFFFSDIIL